MNCPDLSILDRLVADDLDDADRAATEAHVALCAACAIRLAEIRVNLGLARRIARAAAPAPIRPEEPTRGVDDSHGAHFDTAAARRLTAPAIASLAGYTIEREISRGGQGVVYLALQESTKRRVAIKVLAQGLDASPARRHRFEREIELAANLRHPNIVPVFHSGTSDDGRPYLVMDYVRGLPLRQFVRERKPSIEELLDLFARVCDGVQYAHQRGIIHRDLKPGNILVDADGTPKVVDFGLAKRLSASAETHATQTMALMGTIGYMSPEQARGNPDEVDTRSDVYALGVVLYELLTGNFPYPVTGSMSEVLRHITDTPPTPPRASWTTDSGVTSRTLHCPINNELETIVLRALDKERDRRYQSAGELAKDIRRYLAGEVIEAKRDSTFYVMSKMLRRHRGRAIAMGVAIVALALLAYLATSVIKQKRERVNAMLQANWTADSSEARIIFRDFLSRLASGSTTAAERERFLPHLVDVGISSQRRLDLTMQLNAEPVLKTRVDFYEPHRFIWVLVVKFRLGSGENHAESKELRISSVVGGHGFRFVTASARVADIVSLDQCPLMTELKAAGALYLCDKFALNAEHLTPERAPSSFMWKHPIDVSVPLEIFSQLPASMISICDPQTAKRVREHFHFQELRFDGYHWGLDYQYDGPVALAYKIVALDIGEREITIGQFFNAPDRTSPFDVMYGSRDPRYFIHTTELPQSLQSGIQSGKVKRLRVRFVPDRELAFDKNLEVYFGGELEEEIPVRWDPGGVIPNRGHRK